MSLFFIVPHTFTLFYLYIVLHTYTVVFWVSVVDVVTCCSQTSCSLYSVVLEIEPSSVGCCDAQP